MKRYLVELYWEVPWWCWDGSRKSSDGYKRTPCIHCMVLVIPDCTAQIFFLIKEPLLHRDLVASVCCIRLQPFYPSNRKSSGIFRGLTGTQMFTRSLVLYNSFPGMRQQLGNLPLIHKFQFHMNNLTLTSPTSFTYKIVPMNCRPSVQQHWRLWRNSEYSWRWWPHSYFHQNSRNSQALKWGLEPPSLLSCPVIWSLLSTLYMLLNDSDNLFHIGPFQNQHL